MDVELYRKFQPNDEYQEERLKAHLADIETGGRKLTRFEVLGSHLDEDSGIASFQAVQVFDVRTDELLGKYTPDEFARLSYDEEGWHDAEGSWDGA